MAVHEVSDSSVLQTYLTNKSNHYLVLNFTASWAPQCAQVIQAIKTLSEESTNSDVVFLNVDAEANLDFTKEFKVTSVPTVILVRGGSEVNRVCGVNVPEIVKSVSNLKSSANNEDLKLHTSDQSKPDLSTRLNSLINRAPIMLFMKGSPDEPRCGFSRKIVEILRSINAKFETFDILQDEEVRQGLKSYSNWPTYPQLYFRGELVGGLDIVQELASSNELQSSLGMS